MKGCYYFSFLLFFIYIFLKIIFMGDVRVVVIASLIIFAFSSDRILDDRCVCVRVCVFSFF